MVIINEIIIICINSQPINMFFLTLFKGFFFVFIFHKFVMRFLSFFQIFFIFSIFFRRLRSRKLCQTKFSAINHVWNSKDLIQLIIASSLTSDYVIIGIGLNDPTFFNLRHHCHFYQFSFCSDFITIDNISIEKNWK